MDEVLLLDSSYLLPVFGISLEYRNFETVFADLPQKYEVKYNPVSIIEAKWAILRRSRKLKNQRAILLQNYRQGLLSLQRDQRFNSTALTNDEIEEFSDLLLTQFDIRDYFDRQIYSTAVYLQCTLLTEDQTLHDLFGKTTNNPSKPKGLLKWADLA
jgi:hypothetical protein